MNNLSLKSAIFILSTFLSFVVAQHQQQIDPAYLQQYYAQVAQAAGARAAGDATPIFEQDNAANQQPQYLAQGQQLRVKDNVAAQIRAQSQPAYLAPQVRQYQPQVQYISQHQHQQPSPSPPPQQEQQHIQYRPPPQQPIKQTLALTRRPQSEYQSAPQQHRLQKPQHHHQQQQQSEIEEEEYDSNPSYQFGFDVKDDEFTNYQNRKEVRDGNVIKGSYSVVDSDGFIRTVTYTADPKEGFKAEVVREPTDIVVKIPTQPPQTHSLKSHQHQQPQYVQQPQPQQHSSSQYHRSPQHQQHHQQQQQQQQPQHQPQHQEYQQYQ